MADTPVVPELTDEELAAELKQRAIDEAQAEVAELQRIEHMVTGMQMVLSQMEASNSQCLGAAFTLAARFSRVALELDPTTAPMLQTMVKSLWMATADPRPIDANIQLSTPIINVILDAEPIPDDEAATKVQ